MKNRKEKPSKKNTLFSKFNWIYTVSNRFARVDRKGRSAVTSILATLGICFGVMTLITVISIMNGFQMNFIDAIMEVSSYHLRVTEVPEQKQKEFVELCTDNKGILSVTSFYEAQTLMTDETGKESAAMVRAIDPAVYQNDAGFNKEVQLVAGSFDLSHPDSIVLGYTLARQLRVGIGETVNFLVLSGGNDVTLLSQDRTFVITGLFKTGYSDINSSYCFISQEAGEKYFGKDAQKIYGIKLKNSQEDARVTAALQKNAPYAQVQSWRDYNKTFFGALRIEKNMLLLLVALIFVVVGINIYNGMRRLVYERRGEIAIFSAIGAENKDIKAIFIVRGFTTGAIGAFFGVILGLLLSVNTGFMFNAAARLMYWLQYAVTAIFNRANLVYIQENSSYAVYANIPARIFFREVVMIALFGIASPLLASWVASKNVLKMTVAEVLHHE
ncbi:MAG: ABC transporter permease [Treponema sp.]|nr:ABC transporter permease [Treponema sp.]